MKSTTLLLLALSAGVAALRTGSTPQVARPEVSRTTHAANVAFAPLVLRGGASSDANLSPWVVWWRVLCRIMFPGNPPRPRAPPADAPPAPPAPAKAPRAAARSGRAAPKRSGGAAGGAGVVSVHSKAEFDKVLASATQKQLVVVDFFATWCGPCQQIAPKYAAMASELTHVRFVKVDVDQCKDLQSQFGVSAMPTFKMLRNGKEVDSMQGADDAALRAKVEALAGKPDRWASAGAGRSL